MNLNMDGVKGKSLGKPTKLTVKLFAIVTLKPPAGPERSCMLEMLFNKSLKLLTPKILQAMVLVLAFFEVKKS